MKLPNQTPNTGHLQYRLAIRTIRQGGTGETRWSWRIVRVGACENWQLHDRHNGEHTIRERYRGTSIEGTRNEHSGLTSGRIYTTGSLCGPCAVAVEQDELLCVAAA